MSSQHLEKVRALCATPRIFAIGGVRFGAASQITFFDHVVNKPAGSVDVPAHVLALASFGEQVIAGFANGRVRIYDTTTGELTRSIPAHEG
ncbi:MAG: hypothetical protein JWM74_1348, partial [Myxococcaceae bacterium]|nr:hypothetical protein [Myxococcaceae bacterium]